MDEKETAERLMRFIPSNGSIDYARVRTLAKRWLPDVDDNAFDKALGALSDEGEIYEPERLCFRKIKGVDQMSEKVSDIYKSGGNFLNAKVVKDEGLRGKTLTVNEPTKEMVGVSKNAKEKIVLGFEEIERKLALNATNAKILAESWGEEYAMWTGKKLQVIITKVDFQGSLVDGMQVVPQ